MIVMSGLLSVGWHLSHREAHLKSLYLTAPSVASQESWKQTLLGAFDKWKERFDAAQGGGGGGGCQGGRSPANHGVGHRHDMLQTAVGLNGPVQSAAALYHLAHISLHVDIVDCQVYAGAKRLLGRRVSARDRANVVARMETWAHQPSTRHAVLHAFHLLHRVLADTRRTGPGPGAAGIPPLAEAWSYSCRDEPDPHRPWIMYYAALCIWSYVTALRKTHRGGGDETRAHNSDPVPAPHHHGHPRPPRRGAAEAAVPGSSSYGSAVAYLSRVCSLVELKYSDAATLVDGLPNLLDTLHSIFAEAHWELLQEARVRLRVCRDILLGGPG